MQPTSAADVLARTTLFAAAPVDVSSAIGDRSQFRQLKAGAVLFREGDGAEGFFAVESGGLKATRLSPDGAEQVISLFGPGDVIGEMAMFDDAPRSATITALKPSTVIACGREAFIEFANDNPELYRYLLSVLASRLRRTNESLAARDFLDLPGQLALTLVRLAEGYGREMISGAVRIEQKLTQAELGAMIGASRENVSRALNAWMRKGIVSRVDGYYHLDDMDALREIGEAEVG